MKDARTAFGLGQHDGVRARGYHGVEIGIGEAGGKSVDADQQARAVRGFDGILDEIRCAAAGGGLVFRRDRVLEVDDHRVSAARHRPVELPAAVAGDEEQRAHQRGRMRMKTWRRHSATSLLS